MSLDWRTAIISATTIEDGTRPRRTAATPNSANSSYAGPKRATQETA